MRVLEHICCRPICRHVLKISRYARPPACRFWFTRAYHFALWIVDNRRNAWKPLNLSVVERRIDRRICAYIYGWMRVMYVSLLFFRIGHHRNCEQQTVPFYLLQLDGQIMKWSGFNHTAIIVYWCHSCSPNNTTIWFHSSLSLVNFTINWKYISYYFAQKSLKVKISFIRNWEKWEYSSR